MNVFRNFCILIFVSFATSSFAERLEVANIEPVEKLTTMLESATSAITKISLLVLGVLAIGSILAHFFTNVRVPWRHVGSIAIVCILIVVITQIITWLAESFA